MVFLKEFFQKVYFEKNQQATKKHEKLPSMQLVKHDHLTAVSWSLALGHKSEKPRDQMVLFEDL